MCVQLPNYLPHLLWYVGNVYCPSVAALLSLPHPPFSDHEPIYTHKYHCHPHSTHIPTYLAHQPKLQPNSYQQTQNGTIRPIWSSPLPTRLEHSACYWFQRLHSWAEVPQKGSSYESFAPSTELTASPRSSLPSVPRLTMSTCSSPSRRPVWTLVS